MSHQLVNMNKRRRLFIGIGASALMPPITAIWQQQARVWRIGYLSAGLRSAATPYLEFLNGMRALGYVQGKNLLIVEHFAEGEHSRLPTMAADLVRQRVDLIVAAGSAPTSAAQQATSTIPIVFPYVADPVGSGFVTSLRKPGGNVTGLSSNATEVASKHLDLLRTMVPSLSRVAVFVNPENTAHPHIVQGFQPVVKRFRIQVVLVEARTLKDIAPGFEQMKQERAGALVVTPDAIFNRHAREIAEMAIKHRLPSIYPYREGAAAGGLLSYGQSIDEFYRSAATYVDRIFKGRNPGELPVEEPTRFHFTLNRKTATILKLTIPAEILARANEVIE